MNMVFYLSAAVAVIATGFVITRSNAMHALLYLVASLLAVALIFFTLGAPFIAALEVIIYAGAIMVLFIFAIMLLNIGPQTEAVERRLLWSRGWAGPAILCAILLGELVYLIATGEMGSVRGGTQGAGIDPKQVGVTLFSTYLIGVELASILLLSSVIGTYHLGQGRREEDLQSRERMVQLKEKAIEEGVPEAAPESLEVQKER